MEKAVFKATRKDAVHPKQKHVDTLIQMTLSGVSMEELFMLVQDRFSEANWVVSFKALILVHILMHESNGPVIYDYLIHHPNALDMTRFRDRHGTKGVSEFEQSKNVRTYASYLNDKVLAFKAIRIDHVTQKSPAGSQIYQKVPSDVKFMLLEVSTVQKQLHSVLKNRFESDTLDNETTFSAFRYCLRDMLKLFQVMNLGVMKMLKVYFETKEDDMRRALDLYKRFVKLTDRTDEYLKVARQFESIFGFSIPNLIHAPLSLSKALEEFLDMPLDERAATVSEMKSARKPEKDSPPPASSSSSMAATTTGAKAGTVRSKPNYGLRLKPELLALTGDAPPATSTSKPSSSAPVAAVSQPKPAMPATPTPAKSTIAAPAKKPTNAEMDFIDFFSSIDEETTTVANNLGAQDVVGFGATSASMAMGGHASAAGHTMMAQGGAVPMSDFDAMFQALSNPFAAPAGGNVLDPHAAFAAMNSGNIDSSNVSSTTIAPLQQTQPFGGFSAPPPGTLAGSHMLFAGNNISTPSNTGTNAFGNAGANAFGNTSTAMTSSTSTQFASFGGPATDGFPMQPFLQQQQQPLLAGAGGGFGDVSANNPFRQSMYPTMAQSDVLQQQMTSQMAQMSMQQPQQPQQQQLQQAAYNPFAQRQTLYMASSSGATGAAASGGSPFQQQQQATAQHVFGTSSPFGMSSGGQTAEQFASFNNAFGNNTSNNNGHAHNMQPAAGANNGNSFADFDFFK